MPNKPSQTQVDKALAEERVRVTALMYNSLIDADKQKFLVAKVLADVKADETARESNMNTVREIRKLYEGSGDKKSDPFDKCANVKTMIVAMVAELLHAKLFPIAYNDDLTYWVPQESSDIAQADGVGKFMRWALRAPVKFRDYVDDYVLSMVLEGTTATKVTWDTDFRWVLRKIPKADAIMRKVMAKFRTMVGLQRDVQLSEKDYTVKYEYKKFERASVQLLPLEDVGFPCWSVPGSDENKLHHIWHRTRPFLPDLQTKSDQGYYTNIAAVKTGAENCMVSEGLLQREKAHSEGSEYVTQKQVLEESYPLELIEEYMPVDIPGKGRMECIVWVEAKTKTFMGLMPLIHISRKNRRPIVIGQFIRRTHRMYGKTLLDFIMELEKEANTIHNQRLDAGTMSIIPPGVYRAASGTEPEEIKLRPGLMIPVDDINDVKWMQIPNNVIVSFQEERMIMELVEKITSVGSYQSGQESNINRTRATARGTMAIIAQGDQRFQVLGKRVQGPLARVLLKVLEEYQQNIPPGLEERVLGEDGEKIFPQGLSVEDLVGNFDIIQAMDTSGGSKVLQKEQDVMLYEAMLQNPLVLNNPTGLWELTAMILADAGKVDPERYIGPKPQVQQSADIAVAVRRQITEIREGRLPRTEQGENPMQLLTAMMAYNASPEGLSLEPEKRGLLETRIAQLKMELLNQMSNAQTMGQVSEGMTNARTQGSTQGSTMGMEPGPGMAGGSPAAPAQVAPGQAPRPAEGPEVNRAVPVGAPPVGLG